MGQFSQLLDYYLSDQGKMHLPSINKWAKTEGPEADDKLLRYAMEGIRLHGTFGSYRLSRVNQTINDGGRAVQVKPGDKVFASFVGANREVEFFPEPDAVRLDRPLERYLHYGAGPHACLGREASMTGLTAMLRVVGRLNNLRRAPGPQGQLKKIQKPGGLYVYMRKCDSAQDCCMLEVDADQFASSVMHEAPRQQCRLLPKLQQNWEASVLTGLQEPIMAATSPSPRR